MYTVYSANTPIVLVGVEHISSIQTTEHWGIKSIPIFNLKFHKKKHDNNNFKNIQPWNRSYSAKK